MSEKVEWQRGGKKAVLDAYLKLHEGKLGAHWLWCAIMQINAGQSEESVLADFGYRRDEPRNVTAQEDRWLRDAAKRASKVVAQGELICRRCGLRESACREQAEFPDPEPMF